MRERNESDISKSEDFPDAMEVILGFLDEHPKIEIRFKTNALGFHIMNFIDKDLHRSQSVVLERDVPLDLLLEDLYQVISIRRKSKEDCEF